MKGHFHTKICAFEFVTVNVFILLEFFLLLFFSIDHANLQSSFTIGTVRMSDTESNVFKNRSSLIHKTGSNGKASSVASHCEL